MRHSALFGLLLRVAVRRELQRVITIYSGAVAGMVYIGGAEAIELVERALQPNISARVRRKGGGLAADQVDESGELAMTSADKSEDAADGEAADETAPVELGA